MAPPNRWLWLLFYAITLLILASITDTTRRPACFLTASTLAVYLLFIEGRLDLYRGQAISYISLSGFSNATTTVTSDVNYEFMSELLADVLIGLAFGCVSIVLPWPNWSLKRAREYVTLLSSVASMTIMGVTHSLWTTTVVDREAYLVRLRYFRQTYMEAMRVIDQSLLDSEYEPFYDRELQNVRDKRDLLETLMNILHSTSHIIEVLSMERKELQTVGSNDPAMHSGEQRRNPAFPGAMFTPEGLTPLAQQNAMSSDPTFEAFRVSLKDDLLAFASVLDRFILQITNLRSLDEMDPVEHKRELQLGLHLMQRSKGRFYDAVDRTRQTAIFNNDAYVPGKGDIIVGAFLFCIEEISEVLIAFTRHEIRKTREFASTTKLGFFEVGAGTLKQKKHRVKSDDDGNTAGGDNDGWCYAMFGAENGPLYFPRRMAKALLYDFLSVFIAIRLNAQAMLFAPRRLPRRVKEALKMVVSMVLSALCELYIIGYLDPISGGALIPWMCEFQQSTVVYRPKGASTKHDDDDKVAMRKTRAQGLTMDASSKLGEKKNAYEQKFKDNRTYSTTIYHGVYHVMLFRVLGTTSGSVIAYILAEYGISLGMGYAGFLVSLFVCVFAGSFIQTSRNYSSAGAGFIWGSVTISTGFNSFREVAINRFTSNVIAVIIYFIIAFLVWPENAQVNIRVAFDENLRAFRDATVTILLSVKSRKSAERTIREEIEVGHGDGGSDDDTLFLADDYLDSTSETDAASVSGTSSTSMSADQDTSSMSTDERRALRRRRHTKRPPTREPVEVSASSGSELNHDNDSFKRSSAMGSFMGRIFGATLRPGGGAGQSFAGPRSRATYESDMPPSQQVLEEGNVDTQTLTPTAGDLTDTELRLTHFFRRQQLIRSSISALSRTVQREEGLLPAATREPTLEALAFPAEQWRNLLASQRNLLHLLGLLRFTFVTFSMSTTDAEIAESNRKARKQEALRAANGNGSEGGASSMFGGTLKDQSSRQFREAIASGKKRPKGMEVDPSVGGTLFQASQDTSAVVSQSIHWDILKALQRSATKIAIELPSLIDLYLVSIRGESNVPTSQLVSKRLSIQAIQLEMEAAYFDTIIRYARRNMLDDVQQALEEDAEENEAAAAKAQEMEQERMSALLPSGSFTNQPGSPVVSPTPAGEQGGPSAGASADLPGSSQTLEPAAFLPPTVASTKPSTLPPAPVKKSMVAKWGSPAIAAEAATAPPSPSANQISPSHLTSAGAAASSASVTNDSFINGPPISSETEDDKDSMSRRYSFSKPPLGRMPAFGVSPNMVTTEDGNSVLNLGATDRQSVGGDSHDTRSASKSGVGGTSAGTVARTMTEKANDIPELAAALEFGMRGVSDANVNTTKGLLVENARAAMGKRNMNKKRFAEVELANLSFRIPSAGGLLELLKEVKAEAAAEDGKKAATAADKTGKTDLGDNDGDTISRVNDAVRQSGVNNNNNTGNATEFKGDESPTPNQRGDRGGNIPTAATVSFEVPSKDAVASPIPGRSPAGNASPSSNHRKLQVLGKVIKNLVLASVDVHSIEAFLFGLRAVVAEISRLEAAILELRHADETARLLAN